MSDFATFSSLTPVEVLMAVGFTHSEALQIIREMAENE